MLESLPGVGKVKARRLMEEIGIADNRRVQGLGAQQRKALLDELSFDLDFADLPQAGSDILDGKIRGRAVVKVP